MCSVCAHVHVRMHAHHRWYAGSVKLRRDAFFPYPVMHM